MEYKRQFPGQFLAVIANKSVDCFLGVLIIAAVCLCSCSIQPPKITERPPSFRLETIDHPEERRFEIALVSLDDRRLYIHREMWPNSRGNLHFGSTWVTLETPSGILPARDDNWGYTVGGLGVFIIEPGSRLEGFISYENFGDPEALETVTQRKLHFETFPRLYHGK